MKKNKHLQIYIAVLIIVLGVLAYFFLQKKTDQFYEKDYIAGFLEEEKKDILIKVIAGGIEANLIVRDGQTLYETLVSSENDGKIDFKSKEYTGLGFFVTDIGMLHQSSGKYLVYYINGKEASVGASSYYPQNGDVIEWNLE